MVIFSTYNDDKMGKMNIVLTDELEQKFRKAVFERKGMKKGNISEALAEAIELWIQERASYEAEKWKSVAHPHEFDRLPCLPKSKTLKMIKTELEMLRGDLTKFFLRHA